METKIAENFEILHRTLETLGAPATCLARLAEIRNVLEEAETRHISIDLGRKTDVRDMCEAIIGPLLEAGDNLSRCVQTRRNVNNEELQGWAEKWIKERVG